LWDMTPFSRTYIYRRFGEIFHLCL
jgi:hypothetical protein